MIINTNNNWRIFTHNIPLKHQAIIIFKCDSNTYQPINRRQCHNDVIKWKHFLRYWPFVWGIHLSPVNSPHKGQWHGTLIFSLIWAWINAWVNNHEAGDLRCRHAHYDVIVMVWVHTWCPSGYWCPSVKAPDDQYPQICPNIFVFDNLYTNILHF